MPAPTAAASSGRAARCSAARPRSTAWSTSAASTRTSTSGANSATPAGHPTDVLPYFKRAEHQTRGAERIPQHRRPALRVRHLRAPSRSARPSSQARSNSAIRATTISTARSQDGVGYHQTTTRNGKRCSTAVGYLHPVRNRPNLRVVTGALAEKMLFDGKRAVGVAFREYGQPRTVRATREVILCGGAVNSPQLLLLSGVGPQDQLAQFGIPRGAPSAGRRPKPAGSLLGADQAEMPSADHGQRRDAEQREEAEGRAAVLPVRHRPADHGRRPRRTVRAHPARSLPRRT